MLIDVLSKINEILHKRLKYAWWVYDKWNMTRDRRYIYPNRFLGSLRLWPFATNCLLKMVTQLKLFFAIYLPIYRSPQNVRFYWVASALLTRSLKGDVHFEVFKKITQFRRDKVLRTILKLPKSNNQFIFKRNLCKW